MGGLDTSHLEFVEVEDVLLEKRKTTVWKVMTRHGCTRLGLVEWHSPWRRYCFYPIKQTLYDAECLRAIASFCEDQINERKKKWKRGRRADSR